MAKTGGHVKEFGDTRRTYNPIALFQRTGLEIDIQALRLVVVFRGYNVNLSRGQVQLRLTQFNNRTQT